jgi:hypothetical protein
MGRLFISALILVGGGAAVLHTAAPPSTSEAMSKSAQAFLASLSPELKTRAQLPFESDERFNWFYTPHDRKGLPLKAMNESQRRAAMNLLGAGLSAKGLTKSETIRALEDVLIALNESPPLRDKELYFFTIFGEPSSGKSWGWRYEGHHLSQNWTIVKGNVIASMPQFFGANPAEVRQGPMSGTRALAEVEDLGYELLRSLSAAQREAAVTGTSAPGDILTTNAREAAIQEDRGLAYRRMTPAQRALLMKLITEHASMQTEVVSRERLARLNSAGLDDIKFAWTGGLEKGEGHYYRIQGSAFLIEFDNTQNNANHIHTVWRDFKGDFGRDLLAEHYKTAPHDAGYYR